MKAILFVLVILFSPIPVLAQANELLDKLNNLPGIEAKETTNSSDTAQGLRRFSLWIEQPVDHFSSSSGTFKQKLVLFHRSFEEPMVLQTSGYAIFGEYLSYLSASFSTNQLQVEHRYFAESVPNPKDWSKLTVRQSVEDFHRIVQTFKKLYSGSWVNTGASKGGMTSIYHRRFYPDDVVGTVADVAPISFSLEDERYIQFLDQVGGDSFAECRAHLESVQVRLLQLKNLILPEIDGVYNEIGDREIAYESAVIELPFAFFQYGFDGHCHQIPKENDSLESHIAFLKLVNHPSGFSDPRLAIFQPYFYQSAVELGAPGSKLVHLQEFLKFPYSLSPFLPKSAPSGYSNGTMLDIEKWVATESKRIMFVYGELDPWTGGAFHNYRKDIEADNHFFIVPQGSHRSRYTALPEEQRKKAVEVLSRWLNKKMSTKTAFHSFHDEPAFLDEVEFRALKGFGR